MKDYYKCIQTTDAVTLPSKSPDRLLTIQLGLIGEKQAGCLWGGGVAWQRHLETAPVTFALFQLGEKLPQMSLMMCKRGHFPSLVPRLWAFESQV